MKLHLIRKWFTEKSTIGELFIDGKFECFILEDKDRGLTKNMSLDEINKIKKYGETCIPYGEYKVVVTKSERFSIKAKHDIYLPLILNTPGYLGIRIHTGNIPADTLGCLLPGKQKTTDKVLFSTDAFKSLNDKINSAIKKQEEITIEITK